MLGWWDVYAWDVSAAEEKVGGGNGCGAERACIGLETDCTGEAEVAEEEGVHLVERRAVTSRTSSRARRREPGRPWEDGRERVVSCREFVYN